MGSKIDGPAFYFVIAETHWFCTAAAAGFRRQLEIGLLPAPFFRFFQRSLRRRRRSDAVRAAAVHVQPAPVHVHVRVVCLLADGGIGVR